VLVLYCPKDWRLEFVMLRHWEARMRVHCERRARRCRGFYVAIFGSWMESLVRGVTLDFSKLYLSISRVSLSPCCVRMIRIMAACH